MRPERLSLVLSGGGVKALAHAGAWAALEELGYRPQRIVATSMGAVVGACFAAGMRYQDVVSGALRVDRGDVAALSPVAVVAGLLAPSVLRGRPLRETIDRLIPVRRFDELEISLTVVCVDLDTGRPVLFGSGGRTDISVVDALYAACALPVYYPPLAFRGRRLADGGLHSPLPIDAVGPREADLVVAIDVGPSLDSMPAPGMATPPPLLRAYGAMSRIALAKLTEAALARWRTRVGEGTRFVLVRPVQDREATFALQHIARYVGDGYRATRKALGGGEGRSTGGGSPSVSGRSEAGGGGHRRTEADGGGQGRSGRREAEEQERP